ncbi:MAG TPA: cation:proton antiporter [Ilumatobacteraceae bacterium]|nr:cation:proton antiporter [Ilumatobacteraceae bacterium]HRB02964.1 cation:proton antiporter [Ilumatobacteraceae bacterium]
MIATSEAVDLARLLLDLLIVLAAAKLAAELAERVKLPAVLGEILAGVLIGPSGLGLVQLTDARGVSLALFAEIGVLLLLLQVGMEMDLAELGKVGKASLLVAVIGVVIPFVTGAGVGILFDQSTNTAIFIGAALTATSVGITARVFGDLRALSTMEARIVLGAAVADDVLGLVVLTVVVKIVTGGSVGVGTVASTLGLAIGFLILTGIVGLRVVPRLLDAVHRGAGSPATVTVAAIVVTLGFAELADAAGLAFIIGAFMAGLGFATSRHHDRIARDLGSIGHLFIPIFFAHIGLNADLAAMAKPAVIGLAAALSVVAVFSKLVAAAGAAGTRADKLLVGLGMIPRGEVGLIFASIGLANGVLDGDQYGALLMVVLLTTVITPPLLRMRLGRAGDAAEMVVTREPPSGWLTTLDGAVRLNGTPPASLIVPLALSTAAISNTARPSPELLDWFSAHRNDPAEWNFDDTCALVRLLRTANPRAWRFLDITGVLERALPEVAQAMKRRRADLADLDPMGALRFPVVDRLDDLAPVLGVASDDLVLAALTADVCVEADDQGECSLALARRLVSEREAERIATIVRDAHLMRASTHRADALDRGEILQLAAHLATGAHARDSYELALAIGTLSPLHREVLDERLAQVIEALEHPELTSGTANNLAGARRLAAERLLDAPAAVDRLRFASNTYLLSHEPDELARQVELIEPLPRHGTVRVAISPMPETALWKIDVACRDVHGLLARLTDVFCEHGLDIINASIATWADGAVLDSFIVSSHNRPSAKQLALAFEARLSKPLSPLAMPTLAIEFDNTALPWHTLAIVTGPDRPGALLAVSSALATAGAVLHTARISTNDQQVNDRQVNDRFAVGDRAGRKLDAASMDAIRTALAEGRTAGRRRRGR